MQQFVLTLKDDSKREFLLELLKHLEFVELKIQQAAKQDKRLVSSAPNGLNQPLEDFFQSAGVWEGREIDADELRTKAWKRSTW